MIEVRIVDSHHQTTQGFGFLLAETALILQPRHRPLTCLAQLVRREGLDLHGEFDPIAVQGFSGAGKCGDALPRHLQIGERRELQLENLFDGVHFVALAAMRRRHPPLRLP